MKFITGVVFFYCLVNQGQTFEVTISTLTTSLRSGDDLVLRCETQNASAAKTYFKFFKNGMNITSKQTENTTTFITETKDNGNYSCTAMQNNITKQSNMVEIKVMLHIELRFSPAIEGTNPNMTCYVFGGEESRFMWKMNNMTVDEASSMLQLRNISRQMIGRNYSCLATSVYTNMASMYAIKRITQDDVMYVGSDISFVPAGSPQSQVEGTPYKVTCQVIDYGSPLATLSWYKDGMQVPGSVNVTGGPAMLEFSSTMKRDSGNYTCIAKNIIGNVTKMLSFNVLDLFQSPKLTVNSSAIFSGDVIQLTCNVSDADNRTLTYQFYQDGTMIAPVQPNNSLTFVAQTNNSGNYYCRARLDTISKASFNLNIRVLLQVKISIPKAIEGKDLNISCLVQGGEMVKSFRWKVNGTLLENETMQQLLIMNVNRSMVGMVYSCSATPYKGVESQESMATIQKVYALDMPVIHIRDAYPLEGDQIYMNCSATPVQDGLTYSWYKDNVLLSDFNERVLNLTALRNGSGSYHCVVMHNMANLIKRSLSANITVLFLDEPTITIADGLMSPFVEGTNFTLICAIPMYNHNLNISYKWQKKNTFGYDLLGNEQMLNIVNVTKDDSGSYMCTVTGEFHNKTLQKNKTQEIIVHYKAIGLMITTGSGCHLKKEASVNISCNATDFGNPPAKLYLMKDGKSLSNGEPGSSIMYQLSSVNRSDMGDYKCIAMNDAGNVTQYLNIAVLYLETPQIAFTENKTSPAIIGGDIEMTCTAKHTMNNSLTVSHRWYKNNNVLMMVGNESVLTLSNVSKEDAGMYVCQVTLTYEEKISIMKNSSQEVIVQYKIRQPNITTTGNKTEEMVGRPFMFNCSIGGHSVSGVTLKWMKDGRILKTSQNSSAISYAIESVKREDAGKYMCNVTSGSGSATKMIEFNIFDVPDPPTNIKTLSRTGFSIEVTWQAPLFNGNRPLTKYISRYREMSGSFKNMTSPASMLKQNITGLSPNTEYQIILLAVNEIGMSSASDNMRVITQAIAPMPITRQLPAPQEDRIKRRSFAINIVLFDETNIKIAHYDVILLKLENSAKPNRQPNSYTNAEIKNLVVGRIRNPTENQVFVVGGGGTTSRRRRALGEPSNPPLERGTHYAVFVRGYVTDDVFQSTDWYPVVQTEEEKNHYTVVGIVIGAFAAVALVLIVFVAVTIWRRKKGRRLDIRNAKGMQHRNSVHTVQVNRHAEHEMKMLNH